MVSYSGARRWAVSVVLVAATGMAATGCGGSSKSGASGKGDPVAALAAASAVKTVSFELDVAADDLSGKMTGVIDFSAKVRADVTLKPTPSADSPAPAPVRMILDDLTEYMNASAYQGGKNAALFSKALDGKHWVTSESVSKPSEGAGTAGRALVVVALQSDPNLVKALATLFGSGLLKPAGAGHYAGTLDATTLGASKFDDAHRKILAAALEDSNVASENFEVWVGADGLPTEIKFTDQKSDGKKPVQGDVHLTSWGKPVTVTVPAASDAIALTELAKGLPAE